MRMRLPLLVSTIVAVIAFGATLPGCAGAEDSVSFDTSVNSAPDVFTASQPNPRFTSALDVPSEGKGRSFGCLKKRAAGGDAGATQVKKLLSGGLERDYRVHVSARLPGDSPLPVVLAFHGRGSRGADIEAASGLLPVSDREGFLLVSPDGTGSPRGWGAGASMSNWPVDDVAFVNGLLDRLETDFCVDTTRIYAVGYSNGGFLASRLACALGGRLAAIVPVAGLSMPAEPCGGAVAVLAIHGTADEVVPFNGGAVRTVYRYAGVRAVLAGWSLLNGCGGAPSIQRLSPRAVREEQHGCRRPVSLVSLAGRGHEWPVDADFKVAETIWAFLKDQHSA